MSLRKFFIEKHTRRYFKEVYDKYDIMYMFYTTFIYSTQLCEKQISVLNRFILEYYIHKLNEKIYIRLLSIIKR